jgi:hypothetical protein
MVRAFRPEPLFTLVRSRATTRKFDEGSHRFYVGGTQLWGAFGGVASTD